MNIVNIVNSLVENGGVVSFNKETNNYIILDRSYVIRNRKSQEKNIKDNCSLIDQNQYK